VTQTHGDPPIEPGAGWPAATAVAPDPGAPVSASTAAVPTTGGRHYRGRHGRKAKPQSPIRSLVEWVLVLGGALIVALLIRNFLFTTFWIPSPSMQPTLVGDVNAGGRHDRVVVNRLSYKLHAVRRGDIVVFTTPPSETPVTENGRPIKDLIKRVIGLPGETLTLKANHVYIDGRLLTEPYLAPGTDTVPICDKQTSFTIPKDSVLVLGDNRTNSEDGRCFGPIKKKTILGRAFIRIWPLSHITWL